MAARVWRRGLCGGLGCGDGCGGDGGGDKRGSDGVGDGGGRKGGCEGHGDKDGGGGGGGGGNGGGAGDGGGDDGGGGDGGGEGIGAEAVMLFCGRPRRQTVLAFKGRSANQRPPPGSPPPDPLPGPPGPEDTETSVARLVRTSGADAVLARRESRKRVMTAEQDKDESEHGSDSDFEDSNELLEICRNDRVADGKGRRKGAKLALAARTLREAELLPAMAKRRNSLVGASAFRDPKNVVAELPVGAANVGDMPSRMDYDDEEEHERAHAAWRKKNVRAQVTQQRHAATQEKKVGLVNDWMQRQGYQPFVEWRLSDEALPESGWELHLLVDVKCQKGSKKEVPVPRVPTATSLAEWAFAYSTGKAPKGGSPEYRSGPWYSRGMA